MKGMTGAELLDRDRSHDGAGDRAGVRAGYRDPLGLVNEGRPAGRLQKVLAVAAVCGAGLMAGLGLFGGSAARPAKPATSVGIMKAADSTGTRPDTGHSPLNHKPRPHRPVKRPPHSSTAPSHASATHTSSGNAAHGGHVAQKPRTPGGRGTHRGSAGTGAPHGTVRHSPAQGTNPPLRRPASPPATGPHAAPAATPHRAPPPSSPATAPAASR